MNVKSYATAFVSAGIDELLRQIIVEEGELLTAAERTEGKKKEVFST